MDEFNVWGDESPKAPVLRPLSMTRSLSLDTFDDDRPMFDEEPIVFGTEPMNDDGFGADDDFGDFGNAAIAESFDDADLGGFGEGGDSFGDTQFQSTLPPEPGPSNWQPLQLNPMPSREKLFHDVEALLDPIFGQVDPSSVMTADPIRQFDNVTQIMTTPESRAMYDTLINSPPPAPSTPWIRSRIRRQHLIALGIPVNLDEVLPAQPASKAMPLMQITTRPMSAPPSRSAQQSRSTRESQSRTRTPQRSPDRGGRMTSKATASSSLAIGPKPSLDRERITSALALDPERLALLPPSTLEAHLSSLQSLTTSTSELLSYLLQQREALQQDSETYNSLIAELVGEAQKQKMGAKGKPTKRGSTVI